MPTFAEISGTSAPSYADGISILPEMKGEKQKPHEFIYWEFPSYGGQVAVRIGNFKAVRRDILKGNMEWSLYDLEDNPLETRDIAKSHPELIEKVNEIVKKEHVPSDIFKFKGLD
jgi:arylsulfatase